LGTEKIKRKVVNEWRKEERKKLCKDELRKQKTNEKALCRLPLLVTRAPIIAKMAVI
jgi:hypothetical protein